MNHTKQQLSTKEKEEVIKFTVKMRIEGRSLAPQTGVGIKEMKKLLYRLKGRNNIEVTVIQE